MVYMCMMSSCTYSCIINTWCTCTCTCVYTCTCIFIYVFSFFFSFFVHCGVLIVHVRIIHNYNSLINTEAVACYIFVFSKPWGCYMYVEEFNVVMWTCMHVLLFLSLSVFFFYVQLMVKLWPSFPIQTEYTGLNHQGKGYPIGGTYIHVCMYWEQHYAW